MLKRLVDLRKVSHSPSVFIRSGLAVNTMFGAMGKFSFGKSLFLYDFLYCIVLLCLKQRKI